jgi:hypothetical protein
LVLFEPQTELDTTVNYKPETSENTRVVGRRTFVLMPAARRRLSTVTAGKPTISAGKPAIIGKPECIRSDLPTLSACLPSFGGLPAANRPLRANPVCVFEIIAPCARRW